MLRFGAGWAEGKGQGSRVAKIRYLQGSYKNSTNIDPDGDVDIVVELHFTFLRDLSALGARQQAAGTSWKAEMCSRSNSEAACDLRAGVARIAQTG